MIKIKLIDILNILKCNIICNEDDKNIIIDNISINSKIINNNCIFVAFKGKNLDGHDFIDDAINNGSKAILISKNYNNRYIPKIIVDNTYESLKIISIWIKKIIKPITIAITGSCGKTSIKNMVSFILSYSNKTFTSTINNQNNNIGVLLTLLNLKIGDKYLILEVGTSNIYDILESIFIIEPDIIIINNIYISHIKNFKNYRTISDAKSEIFYGLSTYGKILLNYDNNDWDNWRFININKNKFPFYFSLNKNKYSDFYSTNNNISNINYKFTLNTPIGNLNINICNFIYNIGYIYNLIASSALLILIGFNDLKYIKYGIENFKGTKGRLFPYFINKNLILIDDTYNSNLGSIYLAFNTINLFSKYYYKLLIIGDLNELGNDNIYYHKKIGFYIYKYLNINKLFTIGNLSKEISNFDNTNKNFTSIKMLFANIINILNFNIKNNIKTVVLIKGSRSNNLDVIVKNILKYYE